MNFIKRLFKKQRVSYDNYTIEIKSNKELSDEERKVIFDIVKRSLEHNITSNKIATSIMRFTGYNSVMLNTKRRTIKIFVD